MASSRKTVRPSDGRSGQALKTKTKVKKLRAAMSPDTAEHRRRQKAKRLMAETRRHYVAMIIVLLVVFYLTTRAFGIFELGGGFIGKFKNTNDALLTCPATNQYDAPQDIVQYVGTDKTLVERLQANQQGDNLYQNSGFSDLESDGRLSSFEPTDPVPYASLQPGRDADGTSYLRSTVTQITDEAAGKAWLPGFANVGVDEDYHFSFSYRGDVRSDVIVQFVRQDGGFDYEPQFELLSSDGWRQVNGHFATHGLNYTAARVLIAPKAMGYVDLTKPALYKLADRALEQGFVSVAFDDGWKSVYQTAFPLLKQHNIVTTQFVVPSFAEQDTKSYMSFAELSAMKSAGSEIASHSYHHCDQTKLSPNDVVDDYERTSDLLGKHSLGKPVGFAYPYGAYSEVSETILSERFSYVRTSNDGYNGYYSDTSLLMVKSVESDTSSATINEWLTYAKTHKKWLILLYHQIDDRGGSYSTKPADFDSHLKMINGSRLPVKTVSQGLAEIR